MFEGTIIRTDELSWYAIEVNEATDVDNKAAVFIFLCVFFRRTYYVDFFARRTIAAELLKFEVLHIRKIELAIFCRLRIFWDKVFLKL